MKNLSNTKLTILVILLSLLVIIISGISIYIMLNRNQNRQAINTNDTQSGETVQGDDFLEVLGCFTTGTPSTKCLDTFVEAYFKEKSIKEVLADLEAARNQDTTVENQCHPIAHAIGRYAYTKIGNVGDAFESCDQSCHSGCYHGVMERLLYKNGEELSEKEHLTYDDIKDKIPTICSASNFSNPTQAVLFQCLHGIGHAILYSLDYDLRESLRACDLLPTDYDRSSCYGGVVMENVTAFDKKKRDLKREDPLYPCNSIEDKYKYTCYLMQTSIMTEYGMNNDEIATECKKAKGFEFPCFISMGRDLSNYARTGQPEYVVSACEVSAAGFTGHCVDGAIYALIDNKWNAEFAFPFCNMLSDINKQNCYDHSINYLKGTYKMSVSAVKDECLKYAGNGIELCYSLNK